MTPPFNPDVVQAKLALMRDLLDDLAEIGPSDADALRNNHLIKHATERILSLLVQLSTEINVHASSTILGEAPADYRSSFDCAARAGLIDATLADALAPSAGLRNILIHQYTDIDLEIVAASAKTAQTQYAEYVRQAARYLKARRGS